MIRKPLSKTPKSTRSKKIAKLDALFSIFIRRRDCAPYGQCISCGKVITFETADAGHFYNRGIMALRYEEDNVHAQCRHCNRFREGLIMEYNKGLIKKIGEKKVEMLGIKRFNLCKITEVELDLLIYVYKKKIENQLND